MSIKETNVMTVADLIAYLQTQPQEIAVAYRRFSEQVLLQASEIMIAHECEPRPDGWIQNARPDMKTRPYLMFPGH